MNNERQIQMSHLSAETERWIFVTEQGQTMSLCDAAIGILRETGLVLGKSEILGKDWTEKA